MKHPLFLIIILFACLTAQAQDADKLRFELVAGTETTYDIMKEKVTTELKSPIVFSFDGSTFKGVYKASGKVWGSYDIEQVIYMGKRQQVLDDGYTFKYVLEYKGESGLSEYILCHVSGERETLYIPFHSKEGMFGFYSVYSE